MIKFLQKIFGRKPIESTQEVNSISSNLPVSSSSSSVPEDDDCELRWENNNKEEQTVDCNVYKKGEFSHTVKVGYFTTEQIEMIEKAKENLRKKNCY